MKADGLNLMRGLFSFNPERRTSAKEALAHTFFLKDPLPAVASLMPTFPCLHDKPGFEARRRRGKDVNKPVKARRKKRSKTRASKKSR